MCVCLSVQECLCMHVCVFANVHWEDVSCPLDFVMGERSWEPFLPPRERHLEPVRAYRGGPGLVRCLRQTTPPQGTTLGCCEEMVKGESLWLIK